MSSVESTWARPFCPHPIVGILGRVTLAQKVVPLLSPCPHPWGRQSLSPRSWVHVVWFTPTSRIVHVPSLHRCLLRVSCVSDAWLGAGLWG